MRLVQLVITRKDKKTYRVTTFTKRECKSGKEMSERDVVKLIRSQLPKLGRIKGLE